MRLSYEIRNDSLRLRLLEDEKKEDSSSFKTKVVQNLGSFPADLKLGSPEGLELLKSLVKDIQKAQKNEKKIEDLSSEAFCQFLNDSIDPKERDLGYNLGILVLNKLLERFNLTKLFKQFEHETKRAYPLEDYYKFILFSQILQPGSMLSYFHHQGPYTRFLFRGGFKEYDLYDFLSFYYSHHLEFQYAFFPYLSRFLGPQKVHIFYYDGSNFYTFASICDPDKLDEFGKVVKAGLRKFGLSKENRRTPLVSIGILSSSTGIPLFYTVFPGNEQEITYLPEDLHHLQKALIQKEFSDRYLLCADAGNYSGDLIWRIAGDNKQALDPTLKEGDAYIIGRGYKQTNEETRAWARDPEGYFPLSTSKKKRKKKTDRLTFVKSRVVPVELKVKLGNGRKKKVQVQQKQVAIFSTKRQYGKLKTIEEKLKKAQKIASDPSKLKTLQKKLTSDYLDMMGIFTDTGELTQDFKGLIDEEAVEKDIEAAGIFIITTSETHLPEGKILFIYRMKNISEQIFHIMKSIIHARPFYFQLPEHIIAHLEICVQSVVLLNLLRMELQKKTGLNLSPKNIQYSLKNFLACPIIKDTFRITGKDEKMKALLQTVDVEIEQIFYTTIGIQTLFNII